MYFFCFFSKAILYDMICLYFVRNQKELEWLYLSNNRIKNLDGELPIDNNRLLVLDVSKNRLTHLPPELNCLRALRYFYCSFNQLTGLNKTLSKSKKLVWLDFTGNKIQEVCVWSWLKTIGRNHGGRRQSSHPPKRRLEKYNFLYAFMNINI